MMKSFKREETELLMKWNNYWMVEAILLRRLKVIFYNWIWQVVCITRYWRITRSLIVTLKKIDCTSENRSLLKNVCFDNIACNRKLWRRKNRTYAEALLGTKNIRGKPVKYVQKIGKSTLGKTDHKLVRNESTDLESIYAKLLEGSSFAEYPPSPPNLCKINLLYKILQAVLTYLKD